MDYDWKRSVFIPIPKKGNAKECSNYHTIAFISHASKVMLNPVYETAKETLMYRSVLWTLRERETVGRFGRMALKHV